MIIKDEVCLARFRRSPRCEWCGRPTPEGCDPHHAIIKRGIGGGSRLDVPENLVALCRGWSQKTGQWVSCHQDAESGKITRWELLALIARREKVPEAEIMDHLYTLLRRPKCEIVRDR
jgi:hypothetical protein